MRAKQSKTFRGLRPSAPNGRQGLRNPERGYRFEIIIGALAGDPVQFNSHCDHWPFERYVDDGVTIAQAYCYLSTFTDSPISCEKLQAIEADFAKARAWGVKYLLRFLYKGSDATTVPPAARIRSHMAQLKPLLDANWDVIYALQIGWLGMCGENFSGATDAEAAEVVRGTLDLLPPDRLTMVRCPQYKPMTLELLGLDAALTPEVAFTEAAAAKIGFFNDGTCADYWDCGTFKDPPFYGSEGGQGFDQIVREAPFMPVDGELFWTNPKQGEAGAYRFATIYDPIRVMRRLRLHHYTTLSLVHNFSELDKSRNVKGSIDLWKEMPLAAEDLDKLRFPYSPDYFDGASRTAFEYIRDHLGYRIEARRACYDAATATGALFEAETVLVNRGFATLINPRVPYYVLYRDDGAAVEMPAAPNCQHLHPYLPGDPARAALEHIVSCAFKLPDGMQAGPWKLALWLPDARAPLRYRSEYAVRLANELAWFVDQDGRGLNVIGEVAVK
jgi:hypothetical protein